MFCEGTEGHTSRESQKATTARPEGVEGVVLAMGSSGRLGSLEKKIRKLP